MIDRRTAESLELDKEIATATLDSIGTGVLRTDLRGNVTYLNRIAETMTRWLLEAAQGHPVSEVLRLIDSASGATVDNAVEAALQADRTVMAAVVSLDCKLLRRDGVELGIEYRITRVDDRAGSAFGVVMSFRDVTVARAASVESSRVAEHDLLTGLPNPTLFNDRLTQAISLAKRQGKLVAAASPVARPCHYGRTETHSGLVVSLRTLQRPLDSIGPLRKYRGKHLPCRWPGRAATLI